MDMQQHNPIGTMSSMTDRIVRFDNVPDTLRRQVDKQSTRNDDMQRAGSISIVALIVSVDGAISNHISA
jgi:hypothetical protein